MPNASFHDKAACGTPVKYRQCLKCGTVRATPYLNEVQRFYETDFITDYLGTKSSDSLKDRILYCIQIILHGFPVSGHAKQMEFILKTVNPKTVLDYGCGRGELLLEWARHGSTWDEIKGYEIYKSMSLGAAQPPYDLICLSHVLEHVRDPLALLRDMRSKLSPDGHLFVEVPLPFRNRNWKSQLTVPHVWAFTESNLTALLAKAGFRIVAQESPFHLRTMCQ